MADVSRGKDLVSSLNDTEERLKKVERQLAVPRRGTSSIVTEGEQLSTGTDPAALSTPDQVTVVTTTNCLIHLYVEVRIDGSARTGGATGSVYLRDTSLGATNYWKILEGGGDDSYYATVPGSRVGAKRKATTGVPPNLNLALCGWLAWTSQNDAGPKTFELLYLATGGTSSFFSYRNMFAWVQPF